MSGGYFTLAKTFRLLLILVRFCYPVSLTIRSTVRKIGWNAHKKWIEIETGLQCVILNLIFWLFPLGIAGCCQKSICAIVIYTLIDIYTYLLQIVFLADIQRPSVNVIRSVLLIGINYLSSVIGLSFLYYQYTNVADKWTAIDFVVFGSGAETIIDRTGHILRYLSAGTQFFYMTLVFAFFVGHLKQRKFMN